MFVVTCLSVGFCIPIAIEDANLCETVLVLRNHIRYDRRSAHPKNQYIFCVALRPTHSNPSLSV